MPEQQQTDEEAIAAADSGLDAFDVTAPEEGQQTEGAETTEEMVEQQQGEQPTEGQEAPEATEGQAAPAQPAAAAKTATGLDEEAMVRILKAAGVGQQQQAAPAPTEPQMTQEEFEQKFNVFKPTVEMIEAIRAGGEGAVGALAQIAAGINKQAVTFAGYQMQVKLQEALQQFAPVQQFVREQQMTALKTEFFKSNPDLADYEVLAQKIVAEYQTKGHKFPSKEEAFKTVANDLRNVLKSIGVVPKAKSGNGAAANGTAKQTSTSRMSTVSTGGQGAGNNGGKAKSTNPNVSDGLNAW
jgi:transcriptional regulator with XRE-family HTH domain